MGYHDVMDALRRDDIRRARAMQESERARLALEMMRRGIELKQLALRQQHPNATERELDEMLRRWLARNE
jgi:hypothetical protein